MNGKIVVVVHSWIRDEPIGSAERSARGGIKDQSKLNV